MTVAPVHSPMTGRTAVLVTALVVLLAGCVGGTAPTGPGVNETTSTAPAAGGTDAEPTDTSVDDSTLNLYVSDRPNDIDDFASLNVTIDRVGFRTANGTPVAFDVEDRTVDLTELQGANATLIGSFDAPPGEYRTAFLYVAAVDGDLKEGSTRVKLPSGKLQVDRPFTIGNDSVDFVFDVTVQKAGNSGKYILTPVVSESGTDVPIDTDGDGDSERGGDEDEEDDEEHEGDEDDESGEDDGAEDRDDEDDQNKGEDGEDDPDGSGTTQGGGA